MNFSKISGERTRFNVTVGYRSPGFDINDLGFLPRADEISQNAGSRSGGRSPASTSATRTSTSISGRPQLRRRPDQLGGNINSHWTFNNGWGFGGGFNYNAARFDDRLTRGGPRGSSTAALSSWQ